MRARKEGVSDPGIGNLRLPTVSDHGPFRISIDLVAAARRHLAFLRTFADSPWLQRPANILQSIRRYEELWMPLISDLCQGPSTEAPQLILPPLDVQWVWHCHCLNFDKYRQYCLSRFSKLLEKPAIFNEENEDYAVSRCSELWLRRYPSEPFDLDPISDAEAEDDGRSNEDDSEIFEAVSKCSSLFARFSKPYMSETAFLIAGKNRYMRFLDMLRRFREDDNSQTHLVPTPDILLMWLTHQSFPRRYEGDLKEIEEDLTRRVCGVWESVDEEAVGATKKLWERAFGQPYERAGATLDGIFSLKSPFPWEVSSCDVNSKYKTLQPRFLLEVCVFLKGKIDFTDKKDANTFLRLRTVRCHTELKMDKASSEISSDSWQKKWHLYCEFGTRGIMLEVRQRGGFWRSKLKKILVFLWNDLLRAESLSIVRDVEWKMKVLVSITPPVQAPYLLKSVPDRVTDDKGAMISDVILKMNQYHPQEGRWISRTVLDHAGRECFVIRIRVAEGFWRRRGETPFAVKWEERIIEIREGSWSYIAGSIGISPEKVVGTATPEEENPCRLNATWCLSTGYVLTIRWGGELSFELNNKASDDWVRLLKGRRMQYEVEGLCPETGDGGSEREEEGFLTLVRSTRENPNGKATALLNWKLFAVELSPEEDAVLVLLVCTAIIRSLCYIRGEDVGRLLIRRREGEAKLGMRDWGSVLLHPCSESPSFHMQPWYWHAKEVLPLPGPSHTRQPNPNYSPADGGDGLYKQGILL